jgi:hypothetical protein
MAFSPTGKRVAITAVSATVTAINEMIVDAASPSTPPAGWRAAHDPHAGGTWYLLVSAPVGGEPTLYASADKGQTWAASTLMTGAAAALALFDLAFRPSDGAPVFLSANGSAAGFPVGSPNTGAWSAGRAAWYAPASLIVGVGLDEMGAPRLVSTDGASAIVDASAQVPAGMFTGATDFYLASAGFTHAPLVVASNANDRVLVSADGLTFVAHAIGLGAGFALKGLAASDAGFTAIASNGVATLFLSSADGVAWSTAAVLAGTPSTVGPPSFAGVTVSVGQTLI